MLYDRVFGSIELLEECLLKKYTTLEYPTKVRGCPLAISAI